MVLELLLPKVYSNIYGFLLAQFIGLKEIYPVPLVFLAYGGVIIKTSCLRFSGQKTPNVFCQMNCYSLVHINYCCTNSCNNNTNKILLLKCN